MSLTKQKSPPLSIDAICLQKGMAVFPELGSKDNLAWASTVQSMLMSYGYMLDQDAYHGLRYSSVERILGYYNSTKEFLQYATGGKFNYTPLYGDFPVSVMTERDATAMVLALNYYTEQGDFNGFESVMDKPVAFEKCKPTILKAGTTEDKQKIFTNLCSINQSLMPQDLEVIKYFVENEVCVFPPTIPFKENLCTLAALGIEGLPIKSPTDVLRIAISMSGGDISMPAMPPKEVKLNRWSSALSPNPEREKFKFRLFKRSNRKYLLSLLEQTTCDPKDMVMKDQRWVRLGEILHPGEYQKKFPKSFAAFNAIRNTKVTSWYGEVDKALYKDLDLVKGLKLLSQRPGEMARRMDWLLRTFTYLGNATDILRTFSNCMVGASNKVLYELYGHFDKRSEPKTGRSIMIKGARKRTPLPDLPALSVNLIDQVKEAIVTTLIKKFSLLEPLGKVYIDPELAKIPLPTNMRSINFSLKPTVRGQRIPIGNQDAKVIRAFYHWEDKRGDLDPDLSVTFVGQKVEVLSYSNVSVGHSVHSGDIIARKGHNAEYVDIDILNAISRGHKYAVVDVRNFRGGSLAEMDGMFGMMEREFPSASKTWRPDTVSNAHGTQSSATVTLLGIIDLSTMEYIFLDIDSAGVSYASGDSKNVLEVIKQYSELPSVSVKDLLTWHAMGRGSIVEDRSQCDTYFMYDDFMSSYEKVGVYMGI